MASFEKKFVKNTEEITNYIVSVGEGRSYEILPAIKYLGQNFGFEHFERKSSKISYQIQLFKSINAFINKKQNKYPYAKFHILLLDGSQLSLWLGLKYRFSLSFFSVVFRIKCDFLKDTISHILSIRFRRIFNSFSILLLLVLSNKVIGISRFQINRLPIKKSKVRYVPIVKQFTNKQFFFPEIPKSKLHLVMVSNYEHWFKTKGALDLINILKKVPNINVRVTLDIYGDGIYADKIKQSIKDTDFIQFKGYIENVKEVYEIADAFFYGSYLESFGGSLLEARQFGLPCIILDYPPLIEQVAINQFIITNNNHGVKKLDYLIASFYTRNFSDLYYSIRNKAVHEHTPEYISKYLKNALLS